MKSPPENGSDSGPLRWRSVLRSSVSFVVTPTDRVRPSHTTPWGPSLTGYENMGGTIIEDPEVVDRLREAFGAAGAQRVH